MGDGAPGGDGGEELPIWARRSDRGWTLELRVVPGAPRNETVGPIGHELKVKVSAPANEGKANAELLRFIGDAWGVRQRDLRIRRGLHGRSKVVEITVDARIPPTWR